MSSATPDRHEPRPRLLPLRVVVLVLVLLLGSRLWYVQVVQGRNYRTIANRTTVRDLTEPAPRGLLLDSSGRELADNRTALVIRADRGVLARQSDRGAEVLRRVAALTGQPLADLQARVTPCGPHAPKHCWNGSPYAPIPLVSPATQEQALAVLENSQRFPGISADLELVRQYPLGALAAHELGYLGPIADSELGTPAFAGYDPRDQVGRAGLEAEYEHDLRGQPGVDRVTVDTAGNIVTKTAVAAPRAGDSVVLSLDAGVQSDLEQALMHGLARARAAGKNATTASGVVLDAQTGHVVALASVPSYDPNSFIGGISSDAYDALQASGALFPRASAGGYAPGSTFKIVSASAAVAAGDAKLGAHYACPSSLTFGKQTFHNFEGEAFGSMDLHTAIVKSCDTFFYQFGYDEWVRDGGLRPAPGQAREVFAHTARAYGFGAPTGLDLPDADGAGVIQDRESLLAYWKKMRPDFCAGAQKYAGTARGSLDAEQCSDGYLYRAGDAVQFAIGQGSDVLVTPLQLAVAYAALANGGTLFAPRLARAVVDSQGHLVRRVDAPVRGHLPVDPVTQNYLRAAFAGVVTSGTASGAFAGFPLNVVPVAGKTGTAEVSGHGDTAWFASFAPVTNPRYVVVACIPDTGQGGIFAAPVVREVYDGIYGLEGHPAAFPNGVPPAALPTVGPDGAVRVAAAAPPVPPAAPLAVADVPSSSSRRHR